MILELTGETAWNSHYCTEEGQIIYKVESGRPSLLGARRIAISHVKAPELDPAADSVDDAALQDVFEPLAEIEYHIFGNTRIKYGGQDESAAKFFRTGEFTIYGRTKTFTGPDGKEYTWRMDSGMAKLFLDDTDERIATFDRHSAGSMAGARKTLEIHPAGKHMADLILVTLVYMETLTRRERGRTLMGSQGKSLGRAASNRAD